jgi:hypothetical protein
MSDRRERFDIESATHEPSRSSTDSDSVDSKPRARQGSTSTSQRERSSSRPRSSEITRIYSGVYLDDHSVYHGDDDNESSADRDSSRGNNEKDLDVALEVRNGIVNERDLDLEANRQGQTAEIEKTRTARSEQAPDPKLVSKLRLSCLIFGILTGLQITWDGPDDPGNPKNWTIKKKWAIVVTVSLFTFISPVSSSMVAPALTTMSKDLNITDAVESQLTLSIFVLAYAVGPLFLGPLSEIYGRVIVLQLSNLFYLVFNIACGVAQTKTQVIVCRLFSGLGGSAPMAVRCSPTMKGLVHSDFNIGWWSGFIRLLQT